MAATVIVRETGNHIATWALSLCQRMLLLIVGDRIRPNTGRLVDLLQERVTLGFTFGLREMPVFAASGDTYIVQARILMRTEVVTRTYFWRPLMVRSSL